MLDISFISLSKSFCTQKLIIPKAPLNINREAYSISSSSNEGKFLIHFSLHLSYASSKTSFNKLVILLFVNNIYIKLDTV